MHARGHCWGGGEEEGEGGIVLGGRREGRRACRLIEMW